MRALSNIPRQAAAALNAGDPFRLASRLTDKIREFFKRIEADRRRKRARFALMLVRVDSARWHHTNSIPAEERVRLAHRFRRTLYPSYYVSVMDKRLEIALRLVTLISTVFYFALLPYYGLPTGSELSYLQAIFISTMGSAILYGAITGLMTLTTKFLEARPGLVKRLSVIGWAVLVLAAAGLLWSRLSANSLDNSLGGQTLRLVLLGVFGSGVIIFVWATLYGTLLTAVRSWSRYHHPQAYVVRRLFYALRRLEVAGSEWTDVGVRSQVIADIDGASLLVRHSLFRSFRSQDPTTSQWRARQAKNISAAFSEKQRWLMTPKADTREVLLDWLARSLVALLSGAWDELDLLIEGERPGEAAESDLRGRQINAVLSGLRTLAVALLPVLLFVVARRFDLLHDMAPALQGYAELALLGWGVLVLLFMLDPGGMKEKISAMREATSILRPEKEKGLG
jgi:hypothetical protein